MLKIGLKYEEAVVVTLNGVSFRIVIEKRSGGQVGFVTDAPKEVKIMRQALHDKYEEFKQRTEDGSLN